MEAKELNRIVTSAELRNPKVFSASRERYVAEISFKAGQESMLTDIPAGIAQAHKNGIRKAVDYLKMHYCIMVPEEMIKKIEEEKCKSL